MSPEQIEQWLAEVMAAQRAPALPPERQHSAAYRPPLSRAKVAKMRHMRAEGFTIEQIAKEAGCTWRTAWLRTKKE